MIIESSFSMCDDINNIRLRVLSYGRARSGVEWSGNIVSPLYSRLYYIVNGDPYIVVEGQKEKIEPGKCYLFPAGFSFRHGCETSMEQVFFHINLFDRNGFDMLKNCKSCMVYEPESWVIPQLCSNLRSESALVRLHLRQQIYDSLLKLFDKYKVSLETVTYSRCVVQAVEYIKSHLSLQVGIGEIAANSFVSESTLTKKFKNEVGMTIGSYIDEMIMLESELLLSGTDLTVLQISERFGFCDQFYFSRRFKERYGVTPQKYRKMKLS